MIKAIIKILKAINSNNRSGEIGASIAFALLFAFIPSKNILWIVLFIITLMLKTHLPTLLVFLGILKLSSGLWDSLLDSIGNRVIAIESVNTLLVDLYNLPFMSFSGINNSLVIGGLVAGVVLWVPVWLIGSFIVKGYRKFILPRFKKSKIYKFYKSIPIVSKLSKIAVRSRSLGAHS